MAYQINKTDGSIFANIPDGTINTDSSQVILGENYEGYGEYIGENFIRLLENGTNSTPPPNPLKGQLWFDTTSAKLKVFDGNVFKELSGLTADITEPLSPEIGDLWFDVDNEELYAYTGTEFILIGPGTGGGPIDGDNGAIGNIIIDTLGNPHNVVELTVDSIIVAMISNDPEFTPGTSITGFATVKPGIQMSTDPVTGSSVESLFEGTARRALSLVDSSGTELSFVQIVGDTMTGSLILNGDPSVNLQAATKQYVDTSPALPDPNKVNVDGDTMTGPLILPAGFPTTNLEAATKEYVDSSSGGGSSEFPPGTKMVFAQTSAPLSWTQDLLVTNHMLRMIGDATGGTTGGTNSPIASHTHSVSSHSHSVNGHTHSTGSHTHTTTDHTHSIPSHSHTVNSHTHTTAGHTLTEDEMPSHRHTETRIRLGIGYANNIGGSGYGEYLETINSGYTGSSLVHTHGNTGSATSATNSVSASSGSAGSGSTGSATAGNTGTTYGSTSSGGSGNTGSSFIPQYINILLAIKD